MPSTALIAGEAGPVGRHAALALAERGFDVAVGFHTEHEAAQATVDAVEDAGKRATALGARIGDPMAARKLVERTRRELGTPSAVLATPRREALAEDPSPDDPVQALLADDLAALEAVLQADLKGPIALARAAARAMREADGGSIVLCAPEAGLRAGPAGAFAHAAATALGSWGEAAGDALAPDVAVNTVQPGLVLPEDADVDAPESAIRARVLAEALVDLATGPGELSGQTLQLPPRQADAPAGTLGGDDQPPEGLPGIEQRVEPPDPEDRIDLEDP